MPKESKPTFYAVRVGRKPGIYLTWDECVEQVKKFADAKYKKFHTRREAEDFVNNVNQGNIATASSSTSATPSTVSATFTATSTSTTASSATVQVSTTSTTASNRESEYDVVYTDGACKGNGQHGSIAGVGVWWGHNDPRNIAERCPGVQTNNRAELIAIIRVLETTPITKTPLMIKSDSQYSIKCMQEWLPNWIKRGWRTAKGAVANKPLIQYLSALLDHRGAKGQKVVLTYVQGHVGIEGNEMADAMANKGATLPEVADRDWDALREKLAVEEIGGEVQTNPAPVVAKDDKKETEISTVLRVSAPPAVEDSFDDFDVDDLLSDEELREMERTQIFD